MRNRDIHDPATLVAIAYNDAPAIARREQARVLRALLGELRDAWRSRRAHRECAALGA